MKSGNMKRKNVQMRMSQRHDDLPDFFDARKRWPGLICEAPCPVVMCAFTDRVSIRLRARAPQLSTKWFIGCANGRIEALAELTAPPNGTPFRKCSHIRWGWKADAVTDVPSNEHEIQHEIAANGPVIAVLRVHKDMPVVFDEDCVYVQNPTIGPVGHKRVAIMGWGTLYGTPYWLIRDDTQYLKIRRGTDECGIETAIVATDISAHSANKQARTNGIHTLSVTRKVHAAREESNFGVYLLIIIAVMFFAVVYYYV